MNAVISWTFVACILPTCAVLNHLHGRTLLLSSNDNQSVARNLYYNINYTINITDISSSCRSLMVHAITQGSIVTISSKGDFTKDFSTSGTSAGLISLLPLNNLRKYDHLLFYVTLLSNSNCSNNISETVVISAIKLSSKQPIPGGCNMVHRVLDYPNLDINSSKYLTEVKFSPANIGFPFGAQEPVCDATSKLQSNLSYNVYVLFLVSQTCSGCVASTCGLHTDNVRSLISQVVFNTSDNSGNRVKTLTSTEKTKFQLTTLPCHDMLVFIDVQDSKWKTESKYVPGLIFHERVSWNKANRILLKSALVFLLILSLTLCTAGHRLFPFELFAFGTMFCFLLFYIITKVIAEDSNEPQKFVTGFAFLGGLLLVAFWWRFGYAVYCSLLIGLVGGFLLACILFVTPLINLQFLRSQVAFFLLFLCIMLLYVLILNAASPYRLCIVTSSFVGSYITVAVLGSELFFCSMTSQLFLLSLYRFTVPSFDQAIITFPFHQIDIILVAIWCTLFVCGCAIQFRLQKSRPDFPEAPYKLRVLRRAQMSTPPIINNHHDSANTSETCSDHSASFTSENYDGDVSDVSMTLHDSTDDDDVSEMTTDDRSLLVTS